MRALTDVDGCNLFVSLGIDKNDATAADSIGGHETSTGHDVNTAVARANIDPCQHLGISDVDYRQMPDEVAYSKRLPSADKSKLCG